MILAQHLDLGTYVWLKLYVVGHCSLSPSYISDGYFVFLAIYLYYSNALFSRQGLQEEQENSQVMAYAHSTRTTRKSQLLLYHWPIDLAT